MTIADPIRARYAQQVRRQMLRGAAFVFALCLAIAAGVAAPPVLAQRARAPVTVNFVNADIEAVTRAFAAMINRQIAVDPRVRGQITV